MHIAFLNPQGNFDPADSYLAEHPDFGGQLVYVKQLALAMAELGHDIDIITRQILDPAWPEFSNQFDAYPGGPNVRIIRLPAGPESFLPKEQLWPYLGPDWVPNIINHYRREGKFPDFFSAHYGDGGISAVLLKDETGIPFSFTAHSLGAQKLDKMIQGAEELQDLDQRYAFSRRLIAERTAINHSLVNITSTTQERVEQYGHPAYQGAINTTDDSRFALIPPGVNLAIFDRDISPETGEETIKYLKNMLVRDLHPKRQELPCIIASSRIERKKNHLGLVNAYAINNDLQRIANLVILTSGLSNPLMDHEQASAAEKEVLEPILQVIDKHDLRGRVAMFPLKGQSQLGDAYRYFRGLGSIFTLPALHEPFGLAPLEAMAAGLPAVVTKFGGPSESMQDGSETFGILIDPANPEELSGAIYRLLSNPELWKQFAEAGYKRVVSTYCWETTAGDYLDIFEHERPAKRIEDHLRIHPYFSDPSIKNTISMADIQTVLQGMEKQPEWFCDDAV